MKVVATAFTFLLGVFAAAAHAGLLLWGAVWPLCHLTSYPGDDGVNLFVAEASLLFVAFSIAAAADLRRAHPRPSWFLTMAAMALALPGGVGITLTLLHVLFLDPVVAYLALLPGVAGVVCPYALAAFLARRRSAAVSLPAEAAMRVR